MQRKTEKPVYTALRLVYDTHVLGNIFFMGEATNTRNRVSSVAYEQVDDGDDTTYESATHYSYDIHGNVKKLVQEFTFQNTEKIAKTIHYTYDLITGNVKEVAYQADNVDQFYHRYYYDANNRLKEVETSTDGENFTREAKYFYYHHGALARVELGKNQLQGIDYAYNIHGWLKGINNPLENDEEGLNAHFPENIFSLFLNYYSNDYISINEQVFSPASDLVPTNLYNGNISLKGIKDPLASVESNYQYDQLNRLVGMQAITPTNPDSTKSYTNSYAYDPNGNLSKLTRNYAPSSGTTGLFDGLTYHYDYANEKSNRLLALTDVGEAAGGDGQHFSS